ncbi:MAG: cell envelope integrity protein TolA [Alphaproteobacteria bacterium]
MTATIIPVDVVRLDDVTRPPEAATPEPEPETTRTATPQPPPRPPQPAPEPPRPPEPQKVAKVDPAPPPVVVRPEPEKKAPKPQSAPAPPTAKVTPKAKPKPPAPRRDFGSVLKDLAARETKRKTPQRSKKPATVTKKDDEAPQQSQVAQRASIREVDRLGLMIRQQISPCWSPPPGAQDADTLLVSLQIAVDQQGNVSRVDVVDSTRMALDNYFRSAAEAARRAVLKCAPLQLPAEQYDIWKDIKFNFDPSKMLS